MSRVICDLPNASLEISGVRFQKLDDGRFISDEIGDEATALFLSIPGYVLDEDAPAGDDEKKDDDVVGQPALTKAQITAAKKKEAKTAAAKPAAAPAAPAVVEPVVVDPVVVDPIVETPDTTVETPAEVVEGDDSNTVETPAEPVDGAETPAPTEDATKPENVF